MTQIGIQNKMWYDSVLCYLFWLLLLLLYYRLYRKHTGNEKKNFLVNITLRCARLDNNVTGVWPSLSVPVCCCNALYRSCHATATSPHKIWFGCDPRQWFQHRFQLNLRYFYSKYKMRVQWLIFNLWKADLLFIIDSVRHWRYI